MVLSLSHGDARSTPPPGRQVPVQGRPARYVSADAPVAAHRRQGDPAQAAEQDFLPDLGRRSRGRAGRGGPGPPYRVLMVLSPLAGTRTMAEPRYVPPPCAPLGVVWGRLQ